MTLLTLPYGEQLFVLYISREIRYDALRRDYFSVLTIVFIGFFDYTSRWEGFENDSVACFEDGCASKQGRGQV